MILAVQRPNHCVDTESLINQNLYSRFIFLLLSSYTNFRYYIKLLDILTALTLLVSM